MDNFNLRKYLAEGRLLKENRPLNPGAKSIVRLLMHNQQEVAEKTRSVDNFPFDEIGIDTLGDASITLKDEAAGLSFRYPENVDGEFKGQDGDKPRPITIGGVDLMYIAYNI